MITLTTKIIREKLNHSYEEIKNKNEEKKKKKRPWQPTGDGMNADSPNMYRKKKKEKNRNQHFLENDTIVEKLSIESITV